MSNFYIISFIIFALIFIFGLVIGSFLNCVIYRLETGGNFLKGRSFCPRCRHILSWIDLIPVFSFFWLKGKCRYCHKKISIQYPLAELFTAVIFVLILNYELGIMNYGFSVVGGGVLSIHNLLFIILNSLFLFAIASFFILIFVYDLKHFIIPDKIVFPAIAIVFLYQLFGVWGLVGHWPLGFGVLKPLLNPLVSAIAGCLFFLLIFLISRGKWLGFGDVKLGFLMGLFLGFPQIVVALFISYFIGAIIGIGIIFLKKGTMKTEVPFGPFLVFGTFIALFFGDFLAGWYWNLIR